MSDAPERIWASPELPDENSYGGFWIKSKVSPSVEYVRADLAAARIAELEAERDEAINQIDMPHGKVFAQTVRRLQEGSRASP